MSLIIKIIILLILGNKSGIIAVKYELGWASIILGIIDGLIAYFIFRKEIDNEN